MSNGIVASENVRPECKERFGNIDTQFKHFDSRITGLHDRFKERMSKIEEDQKSLTDKVEKKIDNITAKITTIYIVVLTEALSLIGGLLLFILKR